MPQQTPRDLVATGIGIEPDHHREVAEQVSVHVQPSLAVNALAEAQGELVRVDRALSVTAREEPGRSLRAKFRRTRTQMPIDHASHIAGQLELDRARVLHLAIFKEQKGTAVAGTVDVPIEVDLREVLCPNRTDEQDGDRQGVLTGEREGEPLGGAARPVEEPLGQREQLALPVVVLQDPQTVAVSRCHAVPQL